MVKKKWSKTRNVSDEDFDDVVSLILITNTFLVFYFFVCFIIILSPSLKPLTICHSARLSPFFFSLLQACPSPIGSLNPKCIFFIWRSTLSNIFQFNLLKKVDQDLLLSCLDNLIEAANHTSCLFD